MYEVGTIDRDLDAFSLLIRQDRKVIKEFRYYWGPSGKRAAPEGVAQDLISCRDESEAMRFATNERALACSDI